MNLSILKLIAPYAIIAALSLVIWGQHINNKRLNLDIAVYKSTIAQIQTAGQQQEAENARKLAEADRAARIVEGDYKKRLEAIQHEDAGRTCQEAIEYGIKKGAAFR